MQYPCVQLMDLLQEITTPFLFRRLAHGYACMHSNACIPMHAYLYMGMHGYACIAMPMHALLCMHTHACIAMHASCMGMHAWLCMHGSSAYPFQVYLEGLADFRFLRLDGSTKGDDRGELLRLFNEVQL